MTVPGSEVSLLRRRLVQASLFMMATFLVGVFGYKLLAPDATTPPTIRLQVDWVHTYAWAGAPAAASTKPSTIKKPSGD